MCIDERGEKFYFQMGYDFTAPLWTALKVEISKCSSRGDGLFVSQGLGVVRLCVLFKCYTLMLQFFQRWGALCSLSPEQIKFFFFFSHINWEMF